MVASVVKFNKQVVASDGPADPTETLRSDMLQAIAAGVLEKLRSKDVDRAMARRDACVRIALRQRTAIQRKLPRERFSHSAALRRYAARLVDEQTTGR